MLVQTYKGNPDHVNGPFNYIHTYYICILKKETEEHETE